MDAKGAKLLQPAMLQRQVDPARYRGLVREDKPVRWAREELDKVVQMRGRPSTEWPTPTALPDALGRLAELLATLAWDDLAGLARREELTYRRPKRSATKSSKSAKSAKASTSSSGDKRIVDALVALRENLYDCRQYEEALEAVEELLRMAPAGRHAGAQAREARYWRTWFLTKLGRHQQALESVVDELTGIRGRSRAAVRDEDEIALAHALATHADLLEKAGRVAEAAEVSAEVVEVWWRRGDATVHFLDAVDLHSERLARSGQGEAARVCIIEAMRRMRNRRCTMYQENTWYNFGVRLLELGAPEPALAAAEQAVRLYRDSADAHRGRHRELEAEDDWDWDHRYSEAYLRERRHKELSSSLREVRRAEQNLSDGLLALSDCLRQLRRTGEADAARAEAATLPAT
ncbi:hypothetical protein [Embleya sp. NBC_00896]|uniref:hypothetical protein n=1 Tax=Embleya sp. NBC_00896 TaxID=2975961 RepID=UPI00386DA865|nr:hypothetical protein OG928_11765 [Embleya sp. NBC_00896]